MKFKSILKIIQPNQRLFLQNKRLSRNLLLEQKRNDKKKRLDLNKQKICQNYRALIQSVQDIQWFIDDIQDTMKQMLEDDVSFLKSIIKLKNISDKDLNEQIVINLFKQKILQKLVPHLILEEKYVKLKIYQVLQNLLKYFNLQPTQFDQFKILNKKLIFNLLKQKDQQIILQCFNFLNCLYDKRIYNWFDGDFIDLLSSIKNGISNIQFRSIPYKIGKFITQLTGYILISIKFKVQPIEKIEQGFKIMREIVQKIRLYIGPQICSIINGFIIEEQFLKNISSFFTKYNNQQFYEILPQTYKFFSIILEEEYQIDNKKICLIKQENIKLLQNKSYLLIALNIKVWQKIQSFLKTQLQRPFYALDKATKKILVNSISILKILIKNTPEIITKLNNNYKILIDLMIYYENHDRYISLSLNNLFSEVLSLLDSQISIKIFDQKFIQNYFKMSYILPKQQNLKLLTNFTNIIKLLTNSQCSDKIVLHKYLIKYFSKVQNFQMIINICDSSSKMNDIKQFYLNIQREPHIY